MQQQAPYPTGGTPAYPQTNGAAVAPPQAQPFFQPSGATSKVPFNTAAQGLQPGPPNYPSYPQQSSYTQQPVAPQQYTQQPVPGYSQQPSPSFVPQHQQTHPTQPQTYSQHNQQYAQPYGQQAVPGGAPTTPFAQPLAAQPPQQQPLQQPLQQTQHLQQPGGVAPRSAYYPAAGAYAGAAVQQQDTAVQQQLKDLLQFNAPRNFVRASVGRLPNSSSLRHKCHAPLGVVVQPLAPCPPGQAEVPAVSFGSGVVVRCKRCRTYVNPFVTWEASGRRWTCNMCGTSNDTPQYYCRAVDDRGRREDRFERAELCMGSVEVVAPSDYMIRPPQPPTYLFLIDVSLPAIASGLVDAVCEGLAEAIRKNSLPGDSRTMVGIVTYDSSVHFYSLKQQYSRPQVFIVSQVDDMFLPLCEDLLVPLQECKEAVLGTLVAIPEIWRSSGCSDNCMGSALKAATMVIKNVGGKILLFSSAPPTVGDVLVKREPNKDKNSAATDRENDLLKPASDAYQNLGQQMTQSQISVDMFLCPSASPVTGPAEASYYPPPPPGQAGGAANAQQVQQQGVSGSRAAPSGRFVSRSGFSYYDVASFAPLAQFTSGELRFYHGFSRQQHGQKLIAEIGHVLSRVTGWEAVMRIRVSRGWKVSQRHGRFYLRGTDLFVLPTVNEDQSFFVALEMDDTGAAQSGSGALDNLVSLQAALLYTNSDGERRIRVHTFCIPLTQNIQEIASTLDPEVTAALMLQHSMDLSLRSKVADGRAYLQNLCVQLMSALQAQAGATSAYSSQPSTLVADQLRVLAFYIMGILKSAAFRNTKEVTSDYRVYAWHRLSSVPLSQLVAYCCPRMFQLTNWSDVEGTSDGNDQIVLPPSLPLTSESMTQEGAYIIENGESMFLWIGKSVPTDWLLSVFGVSTLDFLHPEGAAASLGQTENALGLRVLAVITELQRQRAHPDSMQLNIIRQGDSNEQFFFSMLTEDRVQSLPLTFGEFLQKVGQRQMAPVGVMPPTQQRGY